MPIYKITSTGNNIVADESFVAAHHAGDYELQPEVPMASVVRAPISKREFLKRFTPTEYGAIKNAAAVNTDVDYFWQQFLLADFISLDDPDIAAGLSTIEAAGLLAAGRAAEIVA
jgi:hypothetical protein